MMSLLLVLLALFVLFLMGLVPALFLTPTAIVVARTANLTAPVRPDRLHREVRPYGGGLAIAATLMGWTAAMLILGWEGRHPREPMLLTLAAVPFFMIGREGFVRRGMLWRVMFVSLPSRWGGVVLRISSVILNAVPGSTGILSGISCWPCLSVR